MAHSEHNDTQFTAPIVVPNDTPASSHFFRVGVPLFLLTILFAFFRYNDFMSGFAIPPLLRFPIVILLLLLGIGLVYGWYSNIYQETGELGLSENNIFFKWRDDEVVIPVADAKNLHLVYEGFPTVFSPVHGYNNRMAFQYKGVDYDFNFKLKSQDHADEMSAVLREWYSNNIAITEADTSGDARYLLQYAPKSRLA